MKTIWKYKIEASKVTHKIPKDGEILRIGEQFDTIVIWVGVDTEKEEEERHFETVGTGQEIPEGEYLGTVQTYEGNLVWHVYETDKSEEL